MTGAFELTIRELVFVDLPLPLLNLFQIVVKKNNLEISFLEYKKMIQKSKVFTIKKIDGIINVELKKGDENPYSPYPQFFERYGDPETLENFPHGEYLRLTVIHNIKQYKRIQRGEL